MNAHIALVLIMAPIIGATIGALAALAPIHYLVAGALVALMVMLWLQVVMATPGLRDTLDGKEL